MEKNVCVQVRAFNTKKETVFNKIYWNVDELAEMVYVLTVDENIHDIAISNLESGELFLMVREQGDIWSEWGDDREIRRDIHNKVIGVAWETEIKKVG